MIDDMAVYIANLGKYNEGYLVGAWFTFPIDPPHGLRLLISESTSPSLLRNATSPDEERLWQNGKLFLFARGSPR